MIKIDRWAVPLLEALNPFYHHSGYLVFKASGKQLSFHRFLITAPRGLCVDHVNRNRLDNRLSNLRLCGRGVNTFNRMRQRNNKSGHPGVCYHKTNKVWVAYIGKSPRVYLGTFKIRESAIKAYRKAAAKRFGIYRNKEAYGN